MTSPNSRVWRPVLSTTYKLQLSILLKPNKPDFIKFFTSYPSTQKGLFAPESTTSCNQHHRTTYQTPLYLPPQPHHPVFLPGLSIPIHNPPIPHTSLQHGLITNSSYHLPTPLSTRIVQPWSRSPSISETASCSAAKQLYLGGWAQGCIASRALRSLKYYASILGSGVDVVIALA